MINTFLKMSKLDTDDEKLNDYNKSISLNQDDLVNMGYEYPSN